MGAMIRALKIYNPDKIGEKDDELLKNQQSLIPITLRADGCHLGLWPSETQWCWIKRNLFVRGWDKTGCAGFKGDLGGEDKFASDHQLQQPAFVRKRSTNN